MINFAKFPFQKLSFALSNTRILIFKLRIVFVHYTCHRMCSAYDGKETAFNCYLMLYEGDLNNFRLTKTQDIFS